MALITTYQDLFPSSTIMRQKPGNGTITVPGSGDARIYAPNNADCQFYSSDIAGPLLYERVSQMMQSAMPTQPLFFETKLSVFTGTTNLRIAGITIFTTPASDPLIPFYSYQMGWYKSDGKLHVWYDYPSTETEVVTAVTVTDPASTSHVYRIYWNPYNRPIHLLEIGVTLQSDYLCFAYSIDNGVTWTSIGTRARDFDLKSAFVGLFVRKWETTAVNAQGDFAYFKAQEYDAANELFVPDPWGRNQDVSAMEDAGSTINQGGGTSLLAGTADPSIPPVETLGIEDILLFPSTGGPKSRFDLTQIQEEVLSRETGALEDSLFAQIDTCDYGKGDYDTDGKELVGYVGVRHVFYYDATADAWHTHGAGFYGAGRDGVLYYNGVACGVGDFGTVAGGLRRTAWASVDGYLDAEGVTQCPPTVPTDGKLRFSLSAQQYGQVSSRLRWFFTGDFDVQMDYNVVSPGSGPSDGGIQIQAIMDWKNYVYMRKQLYGATYYARNVMNNGSWVGFATAATSDTSGKLRITRVGAVVHTYYWSGSAWVELGTGYTMTYNRPMWIECGIWGNTNVTATAEVSNFTINSGSTTNLVGWAREAAGTYRGSQAAFPQHALLISSECGLDIIDVDTNKLWMSFRGALNNVVGNVAGTTKVRQACMKDGVLLFGLVTPDSAADGGFGSWVDFTLDFVRIASYSGGTVKGGYYNVELTTGVWPRDSANGCIAFRNNTRGYTGNYTSWGIQSYRVYWTDLLHYGGYQYRAWATGAGVTIQKWQRWKFEGLTNANIDTPDYGVSTQAGVMRWVFFDPTTRNLYYQDRSKLYVVNYATWYAVMGGGGGTWVEDHAWTLAGTQDSGLERAMSQDQFLILGGYCYYARKEAVYKMDLSTGVSVKIYGKVGSSATYEILPSSQAVISLSYGLDGATPVLLVGMSYPDIILGINLNTNTLYWKGRLDDSHVPYAMAVGA